MCSSPAGVTQCSPRIQTLRETCTKVIWPSCARDTEIPAIAEWWKSFFRKDVLEYSKQQNKKVVCVQPPLPWWATKRPPSHILFSKPLKTTQVQFGVLLIRDRLLRLAWVRLFSSSGSLYFDFGCFIFDTTKGLGEGVTLGWRWC